MLPEPTTDDSKPRTLVLEPLRLFNLIEGLVDHQVLGIHHVKVDADGDPVVGLDVAFLVSGVLLLLSAQHLPAP